MPHLRLSSRFDLSRNLRRAGLGLATVVALTACRGDVSEEPPVHLVLNMDQQQRYDAQEPNAFFADGRAMRKPVEGTVAVGALADDDHLYRGKQDDGEFTDALPSGIKADRALFERGKERFGIFCVPCHDPEGAGRGEVVMRGFMAPPDLKLDLFKQRRLGQIYDSIANGVRNMPSYGAQIPVNDRWAIAAYVRALQVNGSSSLDNIPTDLTAAPAPVKEEPKPAEGEGEAKEGEEGEAEEKKGDEGKAEEKKGDEKKGDEKKAEDKKPAKKADEGKAEKKKPAKKADEGKAEKKKPAKKADEKQAGDG